MRLIYDDDPDKGELDFDGAKGLTGTINAVHDILGMIITKEEKPEDANLAYADQIYYEQYVLTEDAERDNNKIYYKQNNGEYTQYTNEDTWDPTNAYEFSGKFYCTVPSIEYSDVEFKEGYDS